ncbi:DUF7669 domain-containing protein [Sporosarcina sp. CAU 1771]
MKRNQSCRDEILVAVHSILKEKAVNEFTVKEIVDEMMKKNTTYKESTIQTHISSKCCMNSPKHHGTVYNDFERIRRGVYRIL